MHAVSFVTGVFLGNYAGGCVASVMVTLPVVVIFMACFPYERHTGAHIAGMATGYVLQRCIALAVGCHSAGRPRSACQSSHTPVWVQQSTLPAMLAYQCTKCVSALLLFWAVHYIVPGMYIHAVLLPQAKKKVRGRPHPSRCCSLPAIAPTGTHTHTLTLTPTRSNSV